MLSENNQSIPEAATSCSYEYAADQLTEYVGRARLDEWAGTEDIDEILGGWGSS